MSQVKVHRVRYRLARKLREGAKISRTSALRNAEDQVAVLEPKILGVIDAELASMGREAAILGEASDAAAAVRLYEAADRLVGLSAAPRLEPFAKAALGLCDLLEKPWRRNPLRMRAVELHIDALHALREGAPGQDAQQMTASLVELRAHLAGRPT